jgi:hypothetical protein
MWSIVQDNLPFFGGLSRQNLVISCITVFLIFHDRIDHELENESYFEDG